MHASVFSSTVYFNTYKNILSYSLLVPNTSVLREPAVADNSDLKIFQQTA